MAAQDRDGETAEDRIEESGDEHLQGAEHGTGSRPVGQSSEPPDTMTSMNAPISQGTPMFGSTLDSGVISAPAKAAASPLPRREGDKPDAGEGIEHAEALRQHFVHDHGPGRQEPKPSAVEEVTVNSRPERITAATIITSR